MTFVVNPSTRGFTHLSRQLSYQHGRLEKAHRDVERPPGGACRHGQGNADAITALRDDLQRIVDRATESDKGAVRALDLGIIPSPATGVAATVIPVVADGTESVAGGLIEQNIDRYGKSQHRDNSEEWHDDGRHVYEKGRNAAWAQASPHWKGPMGARSGMTKPTETSATTS